MFKTRREIQREKMIASIKAIARQQMAAEGTGAISLRGIARELKITTPALYRYYANRDDLITELIVESFSSLAQALEAVRDNYTGQHPSKCLMALVLEYRQWAITHPTDFILIYGNPIVGYEAPREITVPAVVRGFKVMGEILTAAYQVSSQPAVPPYQRIPDKVKPALEALRADFDKTLPLEPFYYMMIAWSQLHGTIMLELFNHLPSVIGDVDAYYQAQMKSLLQTMGLIP